MLGVLLFSIVFAVPLVFCLWLCGCFCFVDLVCMVSLDPYGGCCGLPRFVYFVVLFGVVLLWFRWCFGDCCLFVLLIGILTVTVSGTC